MQELQFDNYPDVVTPEDIQKMSNRVKLKALE